MATFWFWLFTIVISLIVGAVITIIGYGIITFLRDLWFKRGIPKNKIGITDYIKENPERFEKTNPGKPLKEDKQKELEDDKRKRAKYREFEKLRRAAEVGSGTRGEGEPDNLTPRTEQLQGRNVLPNEPSSVNQQPSVGNAASRRKVRLDG